MILKYVGHKSSTKNRVDFERIEENLGIIEGDPIQKSLNYSAKKQKKEK